MNGKLKARQYASRASPNQYRKHPNARLGRTRCPHYYRHPHGKPKRFDRTLFQELYLLRRVVWCGLATIIWAGAKPGQPRSDISEGRACVSPFPTSAWFPLAVTALSRRHRREGRRLGSVRCADRGRAVLELARPAICWDGATSPCRRRSPMPAPS